MAQFREGKRGSEFGTPCEMNGASFVPPLHRSLGRATPFRRAFTLVELLVVITMIALLAALLVPVFARARAEAQRAVCIAQVRQIGQAYLLYVQDWDEQLPDWFGAGPPRPSPFGPRRFWTELLQPYGCDARLFLDPSASWIPQQDERLADYVLMTSAPEGRGSIDDPYRRWPGPPLSMAAVARPAETVHLLDGWTTTGWRLAPLLRHGAGVSAGFLDGHARRISLEELGRVDSDGDGSYWFRYASADR